MAGATLEFDSQAVLAAINEAAEAMGNPTPMLENMGEYLLQRTEDRFASQTAPDGTPWQALSPRYQRSKKKNRDKILTFNGYLGKHFAYQINGSELLVGTNRVYAAIHQFGGELQRQARQSTVYFKQSKKGDIGKRFVKKTESNFAQDVNIGAYTIRIPARPFLGTSAADDDVLLQIAMKYIQPGISGGTAK
ncbi:MAG: phage virion morphogenesis protein [Pseudomonas sp.]